MATLGVQCQNRALGMASLGLFCGAAAPPQQAAPGLTGGSGHGGGSWYWISDLETPTKKKSVRIQRVELPPTDLERPITEQILREDDELLMLVTALVEAGVL
jgi:hypothetical protein